MGFLDNSGDIILDAVLTDTGRFRLAQGDGTFKITKFALADDEINYGSFNASHASGSAYFDLEVLQTPVLEAFTNNTATMKSKLISLSNTNILYLPVILINETDNYKPSSNSTLGSGGFIILVDENTVEKFNAYKATTWGTDGIIDGTDPAPGGATVMTAIKLDQGLNTTDLPATVSIETSLKETQYIVEMDNRLGLLADKAGAVQDSSFIDDDQIAIYFASSNLMVFSSQLDKKDGTAATDEEIAGPRGTNLQCRIKSSDLLNSSTFLMEQIGSEFTYVDDGGSGNKYYYIDTTLRVTGATTGYRIDVPIRYLKWKEAA